MSLPTTFSTDLSTLRETLATEDEAIFDFETDSIIPRSALAAGIGFYFPMSEKAFYINVGHTIRDLRVPRVSLDELAATIAPFFGDPNKRATAHNATFDVRMLYRIGVSVNCQIPCTLIRSHRCDENLRTFDNVYTTHYHSPVRYGLKELTVIYFNEKPATLHDVIGRRNTINAPPFDVAKYCIADVYNTWRLYERSEDHFDHDHRLRKLIERIDDPNNAVIAEMMWNGIQVDADEAERQRQIYEVAVQRCREEIWERIETDRPLDTPDAVRHVLRSLNLGDELPYDPFFEVEEGESEPSIRREKLIDIFSQCNTHWKREVIALFVSKWQMEQRISSFLRPLPVLVHRELEFSCFEISEL